MCVLDIPYLNDISVQIEDKVTQYFTSLGLTSDYRITFFVYPSLCDYYNSVNIDVCNPNSIGGGGTYSFQMVTPREIGGYSLGTQSLVSHELAHVIQFMIKPNYMPAWLSEGFASFLSEGTMSEQKIRNLSGEVNNRVEQAKQKIGHYPTILELEDYGFVGTNSIDYYLIGSIINDFIVKKSGYPALKQVILSNGQNFTSLGYSSKQEFETAFYNYYDQIWKPKPKIISIKKVVRKPSIDGMLSESTWEMNYNIDRKFWMAESNVTNYPTTLTGANIASSKTLTGYSVEVSIPWAKLGVIPVAGKKIGLELCNYDQDNGVYKGALIFSGHSWNNGIVLNGLAEVTLSDEIIQATRSCQILSPNGDESFITGDSAYIRYNYTSIAGIRIEYSSDSGTNWASVKSYTPSSQINSDSCSWLIPNSITANAKIRIVDAANDSILDASEKTFRIIKANNVGGPCLSDSNTVVLLHLENTLDNNSKLTGIASGLNSSISYEANSINNLGKSVKLLSPLKIPHNANLNLSGNWTIEAWVKLNSYPGTDAYVLQKPGDNDSYFANYSLEVNPYWGNVFFGFYFSQNNNRIGLTGAAPALNKWYHIAYIRDTLKKQLFLIVRDENRKLLSTADFKYSETSVLTNSKDLLIGNIIDGAIDELSISNVVREYKSVVLISPVGGESWKAASTKTIQWDAYLTGKLNIAYSTNNGTNWIAVAQNIEDSLGKYEWTVPNTPSTNCIVALQLLSTMELIKSPSTFTISAASGVESDFVPLSYSMQQNYPNPFNPATSIKYQIPKSGLVNLKVFDLLGRELTTLVNENKIAGFYEINFDASKLASGIYIYQLKVNDFTSSKKMILIK